MTTKLTQAVTALKEQLKPQVQQQLQKFPQEVQQQITTLVQELKAKSGDAFEAAAYRICQQIQKSPKFSEISSTNKSLANAINAVVDAGPSQGATFGNPANKGSYNTGTTSTGSKGYNPKQK